MRAGLLMTRITQMLTCGKKQTLEVESWPLVATWHVTSLPHEFGQVEVTGRGLPEWTVR